MSNVCHKESNKYLEKNSHEGPFTPQSNDVNLDEVNCSPHKNKDQITETTDVTDTDEDKASCGVSSELSASIFMDNCISKLQERLLLRVWDGKITVPVPLSSLSLTSASSLLTVEIPEDDSNNNGKDCDGDGDYGSNCCSCRSSCCPQSAGHCAPLSIITENIALGTWKDAVSKEICHMNNITHILGLAKELNEIKTQQDSFAKTEEGSRAATATCPYGPAPLCKLINLCDTQQEELGNYINMAHEYIDGVVEAGGRVLVYCRRGVSRSPAIVISYLMAKNNMSYEEALAFVVEKRKVVCLNLAFRDFLEEWNPYRDSSEEINENKDGVIKEDSDLVSDTPKIDDGVCSTNSNSNSSIIKKMSEEPKTVPNTNPLEDILESGEKSGLIRKTPQSIANPITHNPCLSIRQPSTSPQTLHDLDTLANLNEVPRTLSDTSLEDIGSLTDDTLLSSNTSSTSDSKGLNMKRPRVSPLCSPEIHKKARK
eukprot:Tbor_TRINITY_DN5180_c0_g1::TRINITY_DN5180_c0_g1_i2::g.25929::m.25929